MTNPSESFFYLFIYFFLFFRDEKRLSLISGNNMNNFVLPQTTGALVYSHTLFWREEKSQK